MNADYEKRFGEKLRAARIKAKYTQEQLAAKMQTEGCDVTRSALAKIEVGQRHIYADEIMAVKNILKIKYEDLFE